MKPEVLLAKSPHQGRENITLAAHTQHVIEAADALFGSASQATRLGRCWLRFFRLDCGLWPTFHANLLAACALHDWGKANDGFQRLVGGKAESQAIRHEHLGALLIGMPEVSRWLQANSRLDIPLILSAVMTHHLKALSDFNKAEGFAARGSGRNSVHLLCHHDGFRELADETARCLGLARFAPTALPETWRFNLQSGHCHQQSVRGLREQVTTEVLSPLGRDCGKSGTDLPARGRLLLAVRAALIAADAVGSGLAREGKTIATWIECSFSATPRWNGGAIREQIIEHRVAQTNAQNKAAGRLPFEWGDFQLACDQLPPRALLLAPCGAGKTLAAWRWIAAQADRNPVGRVIFLYPTRATAKEGFRDYVSWAPEADAILMHGTAAFDLQDMFENESDPRHGLSYEAEQRLFALGFWPKTAFSATVDQFLAFMHYSYRAVCMLPILADAVIVIDEIHSFDRSMFSALKKFLQCFDVPVLCMTATLTQDRREQLERTCGLTVCDSKPDDLRLLAERPRYRLTVAPSRDAAAGRVAEALAAGRRVLWVVNTVARCHEVLAMFAAEYDPRSVEFRLQTRDGVPIHCYHSRFRLVDRIERHQAIVENMKPTRPSSLGITTQVCEMSLDLDVDLLVTEECPVTSLIQRMGRCNRGRCARSLAESGEVVVYRPSESTPYSDEDLTGLGEFLALVHGKELSQSSLEEALASVPGPPWGGDRILPMFADLPYAAAREEESFREGEDYNMQCVLWDDVHDYLTAEAEKRPGFVVPVPKRWARLRNPEANPEHRELPRHLGVAAADHYHPLFGYCDRPLDQGRVK